MSSAETSKTAVKIVFGAMAIGKPNTFLARITTLEDAALLIELFQKHGHDEVDTARGYGDGTAEELLAEIDWQKRGIVLDTKLYPTKGRPKMSESAREYSHAAEDVRKGLMDSLKALKADKVNLFYLHAPERSVPFEETLGAVNALYKEGYFNQFGLSNFMSWEVAQVCEICNKNGWIKPTVYEGIYHVLQRSIEVELVPCLRHYGISLYGFQPLAAGFLTGRYTRDQKEFEEGSRFDPKQAVGQMTQGRYFNDANFDALDVIKPLAEKHQLTIAEIAMRWLTHHSKLDKKYGDAIIVGASSLKHL
ncbi:hypothetical protein MMC17_001228 [Xylographa soralifera]|nr:hypothetical protein [Xylographa soralifera]